MYKRQVNGYGNYYIGRDSDNLIKGDHFIKIGKLNQDLYHKWREEARQLANVKQLFEIQRVENYHQEQDAAYAADPKKNKPVIHRKVSSLQTKNGTPASCPVCSRDLEWGGEQYDVQDYYYNLNNKFNSVALSITKHNINTPSTTNFDDVNIVSRNAVWEQPGNKSGEIFGKSCPVCGATGDSPSSMHGIWNESVEKEYSGDGQGAFEKKVKEVTTKLKDIEKQMGLGGSQIINIAKHKIESIGLAMNDLPSVRVDPYGKIYRDSVIVHPLGVFNSQKESPLVEYVHVDDLPGGTYTQNICNRWNVQVGSGGISMKSYGPVDIGGTIVNMSGEQVNVTSQNEINIDGGKRLTLVADILSIRQRNRKQVLVDSNLGVSQNVIIGGGLHVEGELSCNHITAPCEIQETEMTRVFARLLKGLSFTVNIHGGTHRDAADSSDNHPNWVGARITLVGNSNHNKVRCYDHSHHFKNVPLHLKKTNEGVRVVGEKCNNEQRAAAAPIEEVPAAKKAT